MARKPRGPLARLISAIRKATIFFPGDEPERPAQTEPETHEEPRYDPEPEPEPEPFRPARTPVIYQDLSHDAKMLGIYEQVTGSYTGYLDWRELYDPISIIFDGDAQVERYWSQFLRAFYLTTKESGHIKRQTFYNNTGVPPSEIDWELWRELRRGTT